MEEYDINLKPFKYDNFDKERIYDVLRAIIFFKELIRIKFDKKKIKNTIRMARKDICFYHKLMKKYPKITITTLNEL